MWQFCHLKNMRGFNGEKFITIGVYLSQYGLGRFGYFTQGKFYGYFP